MVTVDDAPIDQFIRTLSSLPADEWQRRIEALQTLIDSTPDYDCTTHHSSSNDADDCEDATAEAAMTIPWYRSSKSVRRLGPPLKTLLLDARSGVVKETTELLAILMTAKLPPFTAGGRQLLLKDLLPSILQLSSQTVKVIRSYSVSMMTAHLIPICHVSSSIIVMLLERMKSDKNRFVREDCAKYLRCVLETCPSDQDHCDFHDKNTTIIGSNYNIGTNINHNCRKEERLSHESTQHIGIGLGRALTDPAQPVRNEAKLGFQVLFQRYRSIWDEIMKHSSGVIRDVRLRKNLLEAASRSSSTDTTAAAATGEGDNFGLFDDMVSLGEMSLNSGMSFTSMRSNTSYRSYASSRNTTGVVGTGRAIPSVIGTPKVRKTSRYSPSATSTAMNSPSYMRKSAAASSSTSSSSSATKIRNKESSSTYSTSNYVLSSGHVVSSSTPPRTMTTTTATTTPTSRLLLPPTSPSSSMTTPPKQPFASLMHTPQPSKNQYTPTRNHYNHHQQQHSNNASATMLRKRLSHRISGIGGLETMTATAETNIRTKNDHDEYKRQLSSIAEKCDGNIGTNTINGASSALLSTTTNNDVNNNNSDEITIVALEVIAAHLVHLEKIENQLSREKDLLLDLNKHLGVSISTTKSNELAQCLNTLTEEQVCDYFESVHICVDIQRNASECFLREMERISQGGSGGGGDLSMGNSDGVDMTSSGSHCDIPQSPLPSKLKEFYGIQRDLDAQF